MSQPEEEEDRDLWPGLPSKLDISQIDISFWWSACGNFGLGVGKWSWDILDTGLILENSFDECQLITRL